MICFLNGSIQIKPFEFCVFFMVKLFPIDCIFFFLQVKHYSDFMFLLGSVLLNSIFLGSHPLYQSSEVLRVVLNILLLLFSVVSVVLLFFFHFHSICAFLKNEPSFQA